MSTVDVKQQHNNNNQKKKKKNVSKLIDDKIFISDEFKVFIVIYMHISTTEGFKCHLM